MLFVFRNYFFRVRAGSVKNSDDKGESGIEGNKICILCGTLLKEGDKMISAEYRGEDKSIVHVFGCPACHSGKSARERICPICKKRLPEKGYLMGRMWSEKGKKRLHVIACTECGGKKK